MSRKPRTPGGGGACGAPLSGPRRGAPDRSRVGGSCGSCIGTGSARRLRGGRSSWPSGGRSVRDGGGGDGDGGRGRGGWAAEGGGGCGGDGCGAEDGGAGSAGREAG